MFSSIEHKLCSIQQTIRQSISTDALLHSLEFMGAFHVPTKVHRCRCAAQQVWLTVYELVSMRASFTSTHQLCCSVILENFSWALLQSVT